METPFFGGRMVSRAKNLADQLLINLYPEVVDTKSGKAIGAFWGCPGLDLFNSVGPGPIRGLMVYEYSQGDLLIVVSANTVYAISLSGVVTNCGTILSNDSTPVYIISNLQQICISDGLGLYLLVNYEITQIPIPFPNPGALSYQDGFGLCVQNNSQFIWQSDFFDFSTWDALAFQEVSSTATNVVSIVEQHREQWVFKTDSTAVFVNAGTQPFAFQQVDGIYMEQGLAAANAACITGENMVWLGQSPIGGYSVYVANGYVPVRMSTSDLEREWASYPRVTDAVAYSYQQEGHTFYVLTFPSGNATWVLDVTQSLMTNLPLWHQRAALLNGNLNRHWGNCSAFFNGRNLIGDYLSGNIYAFNLDTLTDNGVQRKWVRSWRALQKPVFQPVAFESLQIDMQTGIGVPDGTDPQVGLEFSDDGGHSWSAPILKSAGKTGETSRRVIFQPLGSTRLETGLDRIFRLSSSDQFAVGLIGANLE